MRLLESLFANNRAWAARMTKNDPQFFQRLIGQQRPAYLWIGCADSRVPANDIVGLLPGELFVHRNVANVVAHADLNCLSVLQYAVDVLKVSHIIVCGHYGCGGVHAAHRGDRHGLIDNWLRYVQDVESRHSASIEALPEAERVDRLCELNVVEQALNVCQSTIVQDAWARGQTLAVHAWVYRLDDGILHDLGFCVTAPKEMNEQYGRAVKKK